MDIGIIAKELNLEVRSASDKLKNNITVVSPIDPSPPSNCLFAVDIEI